MTTFMTRDFLLDTPLARKLFHEHAALQPIFDFHNHLSPKDIAEHRRFHNLTELWLETDHYKWRAMRACGVEERLITGDAAPFEKFRAWAETLPKLVGNALYYWTHLELQRYFGIYELLGPETAEEIWQKTEEMLKEEGFDTVSLLARMKVQVLCTTDDPLDTLEWHKKIREDETIPFKVCPSFRPDKYLMVRQEEVKKVLAADSEDMIRAEDEAIFPEKPAEVSPEVKAAAQLCRKYETDELDLALIRALDHFKKNGCLVSDHGFSEFPYLYDPEFAGRLTLLGRAYQKRNIVMQLHLGPVRNNSAKLLSEYGPDAGGDSVGKTTDPFALSAFFKTLESEDHLPKTILYNLNPSDNMMLSTMAVNYAPKMQFGAAWWFNDMYRGINAQLDELMETGALASSVGMLTDSRSFTSFTRHEYFRRILCRKIGKLVEEGFWPEDEKTLGQIVEDICYRNAARFF